MVARCLIAAALILGTALACLADSFEELNAQRANLGLPPLIQDEGLMKCAQWKAEWLAAHQVHDGPEYWGHGGPSMGVGFIEGFGAVGPEWGWCTCAMRVHGQHKAGTGLAIGTDGRRYMVLLVQGVSLPQTQVRRPLIDTSRMSPKAPVIRYIGPPRPRSSFRRSLQEIALGRRAEVVK